MAEIVFGSLMEEKIYEIRKLNGDLVKVLTDVTEGKAFAEAKLLADMGDERLFISEAKAEAVPQGEVEEYMRR